MTATLLAMVFTLGALAGIFIGVVIARWIHRVHHREQLGEAWIHYPRSGGDE